MLIVSKLLYGCVFTVSLGTWGQKRLECVKHGKNVSPTDLIPLGTAWGQRAGWGQRFSKIAEKNKKLARNIFFV